MPVPSQIVNTRPISFTSHSIYRIQCNAKTQTRRVMYPQPKVPGPIEARADKTNSWAAEDGCQTWRCPYGMPGDRLYVREMWAMVEPYPSTVEKYELPLAWHVQKSAALQQYWRKRIIYYADYPAKQPEECGRGASDNRWRSPVTMPRWASRLLLEVTDIGVERVQEISAEDAIAEGVETAEHERQQRGDLSFGPLGWINYGPPRSYNFETPQGAYASLWDSINGNKNPWAANPWVWRVAFRVLEG